MMITSLDSCFFMPFAYSSLRAFKAMLDAWSSLATVPTGLKNLYALLCLFLRASYTSSFGSTRLRLKMESYRSWSSWSLLSGFI